MTIDPISAVVVDDERSGREAVLALLETHREIVVAGTAANGREAVAKIRELKPDLLFLDIQMPDANGFEVLGELGEAMPRGVVFVTAHDEYALRAFEVHALDYLLKPFGRPRFDAAIARAIERLRVMEPNSLTSTIAAIRRIAVKTGSKTVLVDVEKIRWVEGAGDYVRVHTAETSHLVDTRMSVLEQSLSSDFFRIHRSCIVRLAAVRELHRESDGGGTIIIDGGVRLRVARTRWDDLVANLQ